MIATGSGTKEAAKLSATAELFCRRFSLAEIQLATEDFSEPHLIGIGGFGKVYRGQINNGQQDVAIKRLAPNSNQGEEEFLTEIETLSKLRHVNLVSLIGYCNQNGEMILVYEYISRGTLADHRSSLTWKQRLEICIGAARGIDYLHTGTSIIHRDVKSTNILLDENFTAKVSDFGLAKHLSSSKSHVSTAVKGTFGYLDPSYFKTFRLTRQSDTYAFGVVLLEVLCERPGLDQRLPEDEMNLAIWAEKKIKKGKADQIIPTNLRDEISTDCLKTFMGIAMRCLNHEPKKRPTMAQVVVQLQFALEQQGRRALTQNASRFLLFWNRVIPSGSSGTGSTHQEHKQGQGDVNTLSTAIHAIPIHEIQDITNNFSSEYLIGKGYNGNVYRGTLKSGQAAAIKELCYSRLTDEEFLQQVSLFSSLKHENMAQLLGYCVDGRRQFLAYEFAQNGSLHDILHGVPVVSLSWVQRVRIAMGAAKGLEYIHTKAQIHCNITSKNVLVYNDKAVKLADFGSSAHSPFNRLAYYTENLPSFHWGPHDYHPPEYIENCELSWTGDVYSFGLVLLELLTGRKVVDRTRPKEQQHLLEWARPKLSDDNVKEVVDARLNGFYSPKAVAKMAAIAALCVQTEARLRPRMHIVVKALHRLLKDCSATAT